LDNGTKKFPIQVILLDAVLQTIRRDDLLRNTVETGAVLQTGLQQLQDRFPQYVNSVRGRGTFCAFNCDSGARRETVLARLREHGVHAGGCGESAVRLRPSLVFQAQHAHIFLQRLEDVLKAL
jgi:4-aminobutyrate aminotransferase/(S)-3-amino-2-methylpropionate transaminase